MDEIRTPSPSEPRRCNLDAAARLSTTSFLIRNHHTPPAAHLRSRRDRSLLLHRHTLPRPLCRLRRLRRSFCSVSTAIPHDAPSTSAPAVPPPPPPPSASKPSISIRKSILKSWKSSSGSGGSISSTTGVVLPSSSSSSSSQLSGGGAQAPAQEQPRASTSVERPGAGKPGQQGRRLSVLNFGSTTRGPVSSPPPDIPPSPQIPQHFLHESRASSSASSSHHKFGVNNFSSSSSSSMDWTQQSEQARGQGHGKHAKRTSTSTAGSRPSVSSSRGPQDSRPSFGASQFEMVSPKMNSTLPYPYHELDQES